MRIRTALAALPLTALAGCGLIGPAAYGTDERSVTAEVGEEFTLEVPASPSLGENWYLAEPRPDPAVLRYEGRGEDFEDDGGVTGSGGGTQHFDFTALKAGKTTVQLLYCPHGLCHSVAEAAPSPSAEGTASPVPFETAAGTDTPNDTDNPTYYLYAITVR